MGTRTAIGTVIGFVVLFLLGWLIYGVLLKSIMAESYAAAGSCLNPGENYVTITIATLIQAILIAWLMDKLGRRTFLSGFITAAWIFLLVALWYNIWFVQSFTWYTPNSAIADTLANTVMGGLTGGLVAFAYSRMK